MSKKETIILGIESSCDDTSASVLKNDTVLSNEVAGQSVHEEWGGIVPELASRAHQQNIVPVVDLAIKKAGITKADIDAIAFTRGPGLMGSLLVGTSFAKSLALCLAIPLVEVNHMQAHVLAHFINDAKQTVPHFPFLCLTVSGGHTQLVLVRDFLTMEVVGTTIDDAAGEAFDKTAKLLGFSYPGGPFIDQYAQKGNPAAFTFTKPQVPAFNFSFSGLKTNVIQFIQKNERKETDFVKNNLYDICASLQRTIISILLEKLTAAAKQYKVDEVAIAGGVSANSGLRTSIQELGAKNNWKVHIPKFEYCTDNAAMIAIAGRHNYLAGNFAKQTVTPNARLKM